MDEQVNERMDEQFTEQMMNPLWYHALGELKRSIYAEQVFCSVASQMAGISAFHAQESFQLIYKLCIDTCFHRNLACGHLIRLQHTAPGDEQAAQVVAQMAVRSLYLTRHFDKQAEGLLGQVNEQHLAKKSWLALLWKWHEQRRNWLQYTMKTCKTGMPKAIWSAGRNQVVAEIGEPTL